MEEHSLGLITVGRSSDNLIVIEDPVVSAYHCAIERRGGAFVLMDSSSNGTFVEYSGVPSFQVLKEVVLREKGTIWFGRMTPHYSTMATFTCERQLPSVDNDNLGTSATLENAALRFESLRRRLEDGIQGNADIKRSRVAWLQLFELLKQMRDQAAFDQLAVQYVAQFEDEAPAWDEGEFEDEAPAWDEGEAAPRAALDLNPGTGAVNRNGLNQVGTTDLAIRLHAALRFGGKEPDAEKFAASRLQTHPDDFGFRIYLADLVTTQRDYGRAAKQYRAILEQQPNDVQVLNNLAWVLGEQNDPKAIDYAEQAAKLAPDSPAVLDTLGTLLVDSGNVKRGIELLYKAVSLAPDVGDIRLNLARALVKNGQKDEATKELTVLERFGDKYLNQGAVAKLRQGL